MFTQGTGWVRALHGNAPDRDRGGGEGRVEKLVALPPVAPPVAAVIKFNHTQHPERPRITEYEVRVFGTDAGKSSPMLFAGRGTINLKQISQAHLGENDRFVPDGLLQSQIEGAFGR